MNPGWIALYIGLAAGAAIAIIAIVLSNGRQVLVQQTRQAQAAQLGTALANQAPYLPAAGRDVDINASIFPDGGGVVRARSNERTQGTVVQTVTPPVQALVVTPAGGGPVNVITLAAGQPPVAQPGQLVVRPPAPPAPPQPPAPPTQDDGGGQRFDPAAAAAAGASA